MPRDPIKSQREEFDAAFAFAEQVRRIGLTAIVDDDYIHVRQAYEQAAENLIVAFDANRDPPSMLFAHFIAVDLSRANRWHHAGIEEWTVSDWAVAIAGECGEMCNAIKKLNRVRTGAANRNDGDRSITDFETAKKKIAQELADIIIYIPMLAKLLDINLEQAIIDTFNAKSEEYNFPERLP